LDWIVTLQAAMTVVGNITLCAAAWWIWRSARQRDANLMKQTAKSETSTDAS
jgi:arginine exporter protein ArgO